MNALYRIIRSLRQSGQYDTAFETYYGQLIRRNPSGAPSAAEARRDFRSLRASIERIPPV
jgi:hypothetical protein